MAVTLFDMLIFVRMSFPAQVADDLGSLDRSALLGGRRAVRADIRRRTGGRCSSASGGGRRNCAAARSAGAPRRGPQRQFEIGRDKLAGARAEVREVRRAARKALSLRAEVGRLKRLLAEAGMDSRKRSTIASLRLEVAAQRARIGELEVGEGSMHAKARFGRKSSDVRNGPAPPAMVARPGRVSKSARKFTTPRRTSASAPNVANGSTRRN